MPEYYKEALKLAQKEYRSCVAKGESPCLPVLDDFLPKEKTSTGIDIGLVQVPAEFIVGTKTRGRVSAFAPNFMPIMEEGTEFSAKWKNLAEAHVTEGIRDPIKAYEYMNRYYVEEGNKRVSVLKYFGAVTIAAEVIRILPEKTDDEQVELYYEFLNFNKLSKINFIEFSTKGAYDELQKLLGIKPGVEWTEDDRTRFSGVYYYFKQAYIANGGAKLNSTVGDAMLRYMKVYGFDSLSESDTDEIKKNLSKMWEDVALQSAEEPIKLQLDPTDEKKASLITKVLNPITPSVLKVAFLYDGTPERSGWVLGHEKGRLHVQKVFDGKIETRAYTNAMDNPQETIKKAISDGNTLIFTTTPRLLPVSLRAAVEHPEVYIFNCSVNKSHRYIRSYYARMYEAKFVLGAIAGSLSDNGKLGYVCDYPIYGQIAGINAFALGAQMVNPRSKIHLEWSAVKGANDAARALVDKGISFISTQDTARFLEDNRENFGLSYIHREERVLLANPIWIWGRYYEEILKRVFNKTLIAEYESSNKALNYYWGFSAGVIDVVYGNLLSPASIRLGDFIKESIIQNVCIPFLTPLRTQSGEIITGDEEKSLSLEQIVEMDYLVENVVGDIPKYESMTPMGQATVDMAGIEKSQDISEEKTAKAGDAE